MKLITVRVQCRGCDTGHTLECNQPGAFGTACAPFKCTKCGSRCVALIKKALFKKKIHIKVNLITHTMTLLNILKKRRQKSA